MERRDNQALITEHLKQFSLWQQRNAPMETTGEQTHTKPTIEVGAEKVQLFQNCSEQTRTHLEQFTAWKMRQDERK